MTATDAQVKKLMEELNKGAGVGVAAARAGLDRKTARKYRATSALPSTLRPPRAWLTREDPFDDDWPLVEAMLEDAPELEAKTLFEWLQGERPGIYEDGQLRTLQRHVRRWRGQHGPEKTVFFAQEHRPGERAQTDFTWGTELGVTIGGEAFPHMLCHVVLPFSNWEHATVCRSESMAALRRGVQAAFFTLGRVPKQHQTDNSTAATHDLATGKRGFNAEYVRLMAHLNMTPMTTAVGAKEQNGDVEAANNALKRRMKQYLLLRGNAEFESVALYEVFLGEVLARANAGRFKRLTVELATMRPLTVARLVEYEEIDMDVTSWSTIRVKKNAYSVPSRLINEPVRVRVFDDRLEVYYSSRLELVVERLHGEQKHRIDYRHIIWSLVKKPGAFARYRYREDLFPTLVFRRAYDALRDAHDERQADIAYLRLLHLAASTMESDVETAISLMLAEKRVPDIETVKALVQPRQPLTPELAAPDVDLGAYDRLLGGDR